MRFRKGLAAPACFRHAQYAQAALGHGVYRTSTASSSRLSDMPQSSATASGAPLVATTNARPRLHRFARLASLPADSGSSPILPVQRPARVPVGHQAVAGLGLVEFMEGVFHRIKWHGALASRPMHRKFAEIAGYCGSRLLRASERMLPSGSRSSATDIRFSVSVPVLSVHSTVAEPSVSMEAARRVSTRAFEIRHAAHRHEYGEHDRELLRQHGHADGDPSKHRIKPAAPQRAVKNDRHDADGRSAERSQPHQSRGLRLKSGRFGLQRVERLADLADFAARSGGHDMRKAAAPHHQSAGIDKRQIVAARSGAAGRDARRLRSCAPALTRQSAAIHRPEGHWPAPARRRRVRGRLRRAPPDRRAPPRGRRCAYVRCPGSPARGGW